MINSLRFLFNLIHDIAQIEYNRFIKLENGYKVFLYFYEIRRTIE